MNSSATPPSSSADDVLERDQADDLPVGVDDERLVAAALAQEGQQPIGGHVVAHADDRPQQRRQRRARMLADVVGDDVLGVQDADDVVRASPRYTGSRLYGLAATSVSTSANGVATSIAASRARGTISWLGGAQSEPQRPVQPHLLLRLEQAAVAALGDEQLDLLGRVHVAVAGRR